MIDLVFSVIDVSGLMDNLPISGLTDNLPIGRRLQDARSLHSRRMRRLADGITDDPEDDVPGNFGDPSFLATFEDSMKPMPLPPHAYTYDGRVRIQVLKHNGEVQFLDPEPLAYANGTGPVGRGLAASPTATAGANPSAGGSTSGPTSATAQLFSNIAAKVC